MKVHVVKGFLYIENVLLAVSGSSIISFICMIIPHRRKIEDEKNKLYNSLKCIYVEYSKLITFINNNITQEDYKYEPFIIKSNRETIKKTEELIALLFPYFHTILLYISVQILLPAWA